MFIIVNCVKQKNNEFIELYNSVYKDKQTVFFLCLQM